MLEALAEALCLDNDGRRRCPGGHDVRRRHEKYAKNDNWHEGTGSFAWTGLVAIQTALASVSPTTTVTAKDVTDGLNSFKGQTLGGLAPNALTFVAGKPTPYGSHACGFVVGIKNGKTIAPDGLNPLCPPA